jgi:hypothetical protein
VSATRTWAGFVLLVVPVEGLEVDLEPLSRAAAGHIAGDPTLGETVGLRLAGPVTGRADDEPRMVAQALISAALPAGRPLAPTVVFGLVVVGANRRDADGIATALAETPRLRRFRIHQFSRSLADADPTVQDLLDILDELRDQYARWPDSSVPAEQFDALIQAGPPAPVENRAQSPDRPVPPDRAPARHRPALQKSRTPPGAEAYPDEPTGALRGVWGTAVGKVRGILPQAPPTPPESMDRLARSATGVSLVYLVLAPDQVPATRQVRNRRRELVLETDATFARLDAEDSPFQVAVLPGEHGARQSPFRPAGRLGARDLPKAATGHFDLAVRASELLAAQERDIASLRRRGTTVTRTDVVLFSTYAPLADVDAVERFEELCAEARVSWILVDADRSLLSDEFGAAGAVILEDEEDVVNKLMTMLATAAPAAEEAHPGAD